MNDAKQKNKLLTTGGSKTSRQKYSMHGKEITKRIDGFLLHRFYPIYSWVLLAKIKQVW